MSMMMKLMDPNLVEPRLLRQFQCLIMLVCLQISGSAWSDSEVQSTELVVAATDTAATAASEQPTFVPAIESVSTSEITSETSLETASAAEPTAALVQRKPVWEIGLGLGYFSGFDYPASKDANQRLLTLPYFIYRSPLFRIGDGGLRAVAIERPRLKLDLAVAGSLNARSEGNSVREGMEDLDFLFELGPKLELNILDRKMQSGGRVQVRLNAELRAVMESDFRKINSRGLIAELGLGISYRNFRSSGVDLLSAISSSYGNERLQDFFYEVDTEFATENRPVYDAQGGYLSTRIFGGLGFRLHKKVRAFMGVFTGLYEGARNEKSPLFETTSSTGFALGVVWTIKKSSRLVEIVDMGSEQ
ncbi:MipA/OmpV family protein [Granulosicoccus antarcticus]|uniref:MipA/OmpV family protein n=1 Tax=Granulosicoccus antarcticus IMCC3135 TaxID=1192854 RepID=A0A2Z2P9G8_9GAMM|nr:MipA/OmpV family protein [Granulosicoccus antarcticus]ASJ76534.1 hypothetical protein IMCC3135_32445 [Granulosicoccus antarcticus IMCC3135]